MIVGTEEAIADSRRQGAWARAKGWAMRILG